MATVIEPGVVGSDAIRRVATLAGVDEDTALGKLVRLWTVSQQADRISASREEIEFWLRVTAKSPWVEALADPIAGFLRARKNGSFEIAGNSRHIAKIRALRKAARAGGKATRDNWKGEKRPQIPAPDARPNGPADATPNATQMLGPKPGLTKPGQAKLNEKENTEKDPFANSAAPSSGNPKPQPITVGAVERVKAQALAMLRAFQSGRTLTPQEEHRIGRAIQLWGETAVQLALIGKRFEPRGGDYDPSKNVSLARVLPVDLPPQERDPKFERLLNLGTQAVQQGKAAVLAGDVGAA